MCLGQGDAPKTSSDTLTEWQMDSLQLNAIQKLRAFYNCISIMSNPDYHQELRDEASRRAKRLFYGSDCFIDGKMANAYIDSCTVLTKGIRFKIDDIVVKGDMKKIPDVLEDENYQGMLRYKLTLAKDSTSDKSAYIMLARKKQAATPVSKEGWTVFICDIR